MLSTKKGSPKSNKHSKTSKTIALLESRTPEAQNKKVSEKKEKEGTTSKINDPEMETFLKERRAVSESRFRLMEQNKENAKIELHNFTRTKSDHDIERRRKILANKAKVDSDPKSGGVVTTVDISSLKEKFEGKSPPPQATSGRQTPLLPKDSITLYSNKGRGYVGQSQPGNYPKQKRAVSGENLSVKKSKGSSTTGKRSTLKSQSPLVHRSRNENEINPAGYNSTTATESEIEGKKKRDRGNGRSRKGAGKNSSQKTSSKSSGSKRQQHSGCEACNSDKEHKEHKKEKRRQKREKEKGHRNSANNQKQVSIMRDKDQVGRGGSGRPAIPPLPKEYEYRSSKSNTFQKILMQDEDEKNEQRRLEERVSRSRRCKASDRVTKDLKEIMKRPTSNLLLNQKKVVSESKFRQFSDEEKYNDRNQSRDLMLYPRPFQDVEINQKKNLIDGSVQQEHGLEPAATFHRSISNLEKRNQESETVERHDDANEKDLSPCRPHSEMSQRSSEGYRPKSLPRPGSARSQHSQSSLMDQQDYKNYILEVLHATTKNQRFQQLRNYYNILDRALKLEKKSSNMDIHHLNSDDVIDFETWRVMRHKEKAKEELSLLMNNLKRAQKERQFLFRPKEVDEFRWRGDIRLRGRDQSVENIRNQFTKIAATKGQSNRQFQKIKELNEQKDTYRLNWRATHSSLPAPVRKEYKAKEKATKALEAPVDQKNEGATIKVKPEIHNLEQKESSLKAVEYAASPKSQPATLSYLNKKKRSTLTSQQVYNIKGQLNDIYCSANSLSQARSNCSVRNATTSAVSSPLTNLGHMKEKLESKNLFSKPLPDVVRYSRGKKSVTGKQKLSLRHAKSPSPLPGGKSRDSSKDSVVDEKQKELSYRIGKEVVAKCIKKGIGKDEIVPPHSTTIVMVAERGQSVPKKAEFDFTETKPPLRFSADSTQNTNSEFGERVTSPRTCYSIEADHEQQATSSMKTEETDNPPHTESNDFLLVLQTDEKDKPIKDDQLKTIVDHWATSGDEGNGKTSPKRSRKDKLSHNKADSKKTNNSSKSADSTNSTSPSTSARSANTVIFRRKSRSRSCDKKTRDGIDEASRTVKEIKISFEEQAKRTDTAVDNSFLNENTKLNNRNFSPISTNERVRSPSVREIRKSFENINASCHERPEEPFYLSLRRRLRSPSVREVRKSFENINASCGDKREDSFSSSLRRRLRSPSVRELRFSFENIHNLVDRNESPPKTPIRSSSFYKASYVEKRDTMTPERSLSRASLASKRMSSAEDMTVHSRDRQMVSGRNLYQRIRQKSPVPKIKHFLPPASQRSVSQPDLSDTEQQNHQRRKLTYPTTRPRSSGTSSRINQIVDTIYSTGVDLSAYGKPPHAGTSYTLGREKGTNNSKYTRAYLNLVKTGDVFSKGRLFGNVNTAPKMYSSLTEAKMYERKKSAENRSQSNDDAKIKGTSSGNVIMRTKEIPDLEHIRQKLELKANKNALSNQDEVNVDRSDTKSPHFKGAPKFKFISKAVGHSKIIGKMMELKEASGANGEIDEGTLKLCDKANATHEYFNVYKSGEVDSMVQKFEGAMIKTIDKKLDKDLDDVDEVAIERRSKSPSWAKIGSERQTFSWSKRLGATSPSRMDSSGAYNNAQKQLMYRKYYGYNDIATEAAKKDDRDGHTSLKISSDPIYLRSRQVFERLDQTMPRTRSRDALISPRPYSRMSSEEKELGTSNFDLRKTYSLPRRFASTAASKTSVGASPLVAPAILRESLSQLEKLDDEDSSVKKSENQKDSNLASDDTPTFISLPPEAELTSTEQQNEDKVVDVKSDEADNDAKDDINEEPIYGKIIKSEGKSLE